MIVEDTLATLAGYVAYITVFASVLVVLKLLFRIPQNVFRKFLHVAAFTSSIFVALTGRGWLAETFTLVLFAALVYPALCLAERWSGFSHLLVEKKPGEIRSSLLLLFLSQAALLAFSCGLLKRPYVLVAATTAWGLGDIAAAWVGRPLGRHKIHLRFADPLKSWEGSAAMALVAFVACFASLRWLAPFGLARSLAVSVVVALVSSLTEMASKGGMDTVTVPVANALVLALL